MASQKISQLTAITTVASGDYFPVVQASSSTNKRVDVGVLDVRYTSAASGVAAQTTANTALASGNAALVSSSAAQVSSNTALASGNAALSGLTGKYDKTGGPISGPVTILSQSVGRPAAGGLVGGVITLDFSSCNNFDITLGLNSTLAAPIGPSGGQCGAITVRQDGTGSRTLAYSGGWQFAGGAAPTLTTTASGVDILTYYVTSPREIQTIATLNYRP
jgi:hypothetical protein